MEPVIGNENPVVGGQNAEPKESLVLWIVGFLLGLFLPVIGVILSLLLHKSARKGSLWGSVFFLAVFTFWALYSFHGNLHLMLSTKPWGERVRRAKQANAMFVEKLRGTHKVGVKKTFNPILKSNSNQDLLKQQLPVEKNTSAQILNKENGKVEIIHSEAPKLADSGIQNIKFSSPQTEKPQLTTPTIQNSIAHSDQVESKEIKPESIEGVKIKETIPQNSKPENIQTDQVKSENIKLQDTTAEAKKVEQIQIEENTLEKVELEHSEPDNLKSKVIQPENDSEKDPKEINKEIDSTITKNVEVEGAKLNINL